MKFRILFFICLLIPALSFSQERVLTFGVQFKPMIPVSLVENDLVETDLGGVNYQTQQNFGYSFGFLIRKGITKKISLETGIAYVKRNFSLGIDSIGSNFNQDLNYGIVGYEIPVLGLIYIQLSREMFMNVSMGGALDLYPSDVGTDRAANGEWIHETVRRNWLQTSVLANIGWEYRTKEKGIFYVGASYHRPFDYIFLSKIGVKQVGAGRPEVSQELNGNYLTLDFRYFFHEDPEKRKLKKKKSKKSKAEMRKSY